MRVFEIRDTANNKLRFPDELLSTEPLSHALNCTKLLHGRCEIHHLARRSSTRCVRNYASLRKTRDGILPSTFITEVFGNDVELIIGLQLFKAMRSINVAFFKKLEIELTHCIFNHLQENPLIAFLHLYRSLEKLAVAFPLIYISAKTDFENSVESLRVYFEESGGELSFARKFAKDIATQSSVLTEYSIDFQTKIQEIDKYTVLLNEINRCCPNHISGDIDPSSGKFSIEFEKVPSFLVNCRNRMFHFSNSGQKNFNIDNIEGVDELCRILVKSGLHWLALTYDEVLRRQSDRIILN